MGNATCFIYILMILLFPFSKMVPSAARSVCTWASRTQLGTVTLQGHTRQMFSAAFRVKKDKKKKRIV